MLRFSRRRASMLGAFFALAASAACQVLAGIDEKTAAPAPVAEAGVVDAPVGPECTTSAQCVTAHAAGSVCVKATGKCQSLFSSDCDTVLAGARGAAEAEQHAIWANDDTLFLGFVTDLRASGKAAGIARRQAVELAVQAIATNHGIPGGAGGSRRPVAVIACSETKDDGSSDPKVPAAHLIGDLHVPAIIGASNSDATIELFYNAAYPASTLVFAPNAQSSRLSAPTDDGLFWRTAAADPAQAKALQQQVGLVEQQVESGGVNIGEARLALLYLDNGFGQDIVPQITSGLTWNGSPLGAGANGSTCETAPCAANQRVLVRKYTGTTDQELGNVAGELAFFKPHVILAVGGTDAIKIAAAYEAQLQALDPTPLYVFAQNAATSDIALLTSAGASIQSRVRGVRQTLAADEPTTFVSQYNLAFPSGPPDTLGVPGSYDITYLLAYAAVAAPVDAAAPLTGPALVQGLRRVLDKTGTVYRTTPDTIGTATDALSAGSFLNVKGYSYTGTFDVDAGEAPSTFDIWCVGSTNELRSSGQVYDPNAPDGGATTGTFACPN